MKPQSLLLMLVLAQLVIILKSLLLTMKLSLTAMILENLPLILELSLQVLIIESLILILELFLLAQMVFWLFLILVLIIVVKILQSLPLMLQLIFVEKLFDYLPLKSMSTCKPMKQDFAQVITLIRLVSKEINLIFKYSSKQQFHLQLLLKSYLHSKQHPKFFSSMNCKDNLIFFPHMSITITIDFRLILIPQYQ